MSGQVYRIERIIKKNVIDVFLELLIMQLRQN